MVETQTDTDKIKKLQKALILAMEEEELEVRERKVDKLTMEIAGIRAMVARRGEMEILAKEVENRDTLRKKAEKILSKVEAQGIAINEFLGQVSEISEPLGDLVEKAKALPKLQLKISEIYTDTGRLGWGAGRLPKGFLPDHITAPTLQMRGGTRSAFNVGQEIVFHLYQAYGLLRALQRVEVAIPTRAPRDFEVLGEELLEVERDCFVCKDSQRETIDKMLNEGKSLREIEVATGISRSSLSKHNRNCLRGE